MDGCFSPLCSIFIFSSSLVGGSNFIGSGLIFIVGSVWFESSIFREGGSKFTGSSILADGSESIDGSMYTKVISFVKFQNPASKNRR